MKHVIVLTCVKQELATISIFLHYLYRSSQTWIIVIRKDVFYAVTNSTEDKS